MLTNTPIVSIRDKDCLIGLETKILALPIEIQQLYADCKNEINFGEILPDYKSDNQHPIRTFKTWFENEKTFKQGEFTQDDEGVYQLDGCGVIIVNNPEEKSLQIGRWKLDQPHGLILKIEKKLSDYNTVIKK